MIHLIDKDALVARIKKLKMDIGSIFNEYDEGFWEGRTTAFDDVICALDTIEMKEVNFEKMWEEYFKYRGDMATVNVKHLAKHFFELGLKAKKGE